MPRCFLCAFALFAVAFLGGCDTDNPSTPLEQLEGVYVFSELTFDPSEPQILDDVDVLSQLVQSSSDVEVFGTGPALIRFKLQDEPSVRADANVTATGPSVRFVAATEADAARLSEILLPPSFTLSRGADDDRLSGEIRTSANLQAFDPDLYAGLTSQPGTLYITLSRDLDRE